MVHMWDTTKDYRLLLGQKTIGMFVGTVRSGSFRGRWNKKMAIESAENMESDFQTLNYSYLDPEDLANTFEISTLEEKADLVVKYLGGEDWAHQFMSQTPKEDKEKVEEAIAKTRFFIDTISGIKNRILFGPINDPIVAIDIKIGEIMNVSKHPLNEGLMICNINLGKRAIKVVTNDLEVKEGNNVAIAMLPPETFSGIASEGMFLGAGEGILKDVEGELGSMPKGIPLEALNESRNLIKSYLSK
ncbi:Phenylalanine--tRNA ligase beta subunit [Candidatus Methanobinarius endosymbioticus]|uniref:Phenylalanine--tRNA ligase beta subunit n=1 Tax=Candidatus Methanobinarius endosymbioticus TaxID=2006182 RepID=A0A366MFH3_9EURY|nr:Phenylalanine--tRNA ligase beta subunit [Candidatus Methanobinarius endosymbioticus]